MCSLTVCSCHLHKFSAVPWCSFLMPYSRHQGGDFCKSPCTLVAKAINTNRVTNLDHWQMAKPNNYPPKVPSLLSSTLTTVPQLPLSGLDCQSEFAPVCTKVFSRPPMTLIAGLSIFLRTQIFLFVLARCCILLPCLMQSNELSLYCRHR